MKRSCISCSAVYKRWFCQGWMSEWMNEWNFLHHFIVNQNQLKAVLYMYLSMTSTEPACMDQKAFQSSPLVATDVLLPWQALPTLWSQLQAAASGMEVFNMVQSNSMPPAFPKIQEKFLRKWEFEGLADGDLTLTPFQVSSLRPTTVLKFPSRAMQSPGGTLSETPPRDSLTVATTATIKPSKEIK